MTAQTPCACPTVKARTPPRKLWWGTGPFCVFVRLQEPLRNGTQGAAALAAPGARPADGLSCGRRSAPVASMSVLTAVNTPGLVDRGQRSLKPVLTVPRVYGPRRALDVVLKFLDQGL